MSGDNTFIPNLSQTNGKLALVNSTVQLPAQECPSDASIVDLVGYGSANCFEGAPTPVLSRTTAGIRDGEGCNDSDNNSNDFTPRNTSSATNACDTAGELAASGAANPGILAPEDTTLLTVTVFPATSPASTGIAVTADLTNIGGTASQQFFDDGEGRDIGGRADQQEDQHHPGTEAGGK